MRAAGADELVADLQLHSTASDGSDPPADVVRRASSMGFASVALTDHDTMDGVPEARQAAAAIGQRRTASRSHDGVERAPGAAGSRATAF